MTGGGEGVFELVLKASKRKKKKKRKKNSPGTFDLTKLQINAAHSSDWRSHLWGNTTETAHFPPLWKGSNPLQLRLIDFNNPFPPTRSIPPVLRGCFLTSEVVLHLCVKVLGPSLRFTIYWLLYNVSRGSPGDFAPCLAGGPALREKKADVFS